MTALAPKKLAEVDTVIQNCIKISTIHQDQRRVVPGVDLCGGPLEAGDSDEQAEGVLRLAIPLFYVFRHCFGTGRELARSFRADD
jgi:hypothetical protein